MPIIPALGRQTQESFNLKFNDNLDYVMSFGPA